jgi:hypothetical protein
MLPSNSTEPSDSLETLYLWNTTDMGIFKYCLVFIPTAKRDSIWSILFNICYTNCRIHFHKEPINVTFKHIYIYIYTHTHTHTSFVELEAKFNTNSLLLNIRHFVNSRHTWKRCKENSQNSETRAIIKTPVGWLTVERYSKRYLAAQVRSAYGLRGIFKFSKILGSTSYILTKCFTHKPSPGRAHKLLM